jgi:hypothetical protein
VPPELVNNGTVYQRFEEWASNPFRTGRNAWFDAQSLAYMVENDVEEMFFTKPVSKSWDRKVAILDQGNLGSCTGNAGTGTVGTEPYFSVVGAKFTKVFGSFAEPAAVEVYHEATIADPYPGTYPPDDTGSSGLAVCKVLKSKGIIGGYRWARTPHGLATLLQSGPVMWGAPWYEGWFDPDRNGFVDTGTWGGIAGGHEFENFSIEINSQDFYKSVLTFDNSWGTSWGDAGRFRMYLSSYEKISGIDLKQFTA